MSGLEEKTIRSRTIFDGKLIRVQLDEVKLPDGRTSTREIVKHPGAVAVLAFTKDGKLVLVRQYRNPLEKIILEIPAGKLEPGEDPKACAFRELEEETGYRAKEMEPVVSFYTSPGFADEKIYLFEARGLDKGEMHPDTDEFVEVEEVTLEEAFAKIEEGQICDAKTMVAVYFWRNRVLGPR